MLARPVQVGKSGVRPHALTRLRGMDRPLPRPYPTLMSDYHAMPDGRRIAYRLTQGSGTAPAIVFLPGYMSDMAGSKASALFDWAAANRHTCLLLDYSGCGESDGDFADGTLSRWRDEVLSLIEAKLGGPVVLVGSSMGGWLMLLVALVQQVLMGNLSTPTGLADALPKSMPDALRQRLMAGAMASAAGIPFNMDAWDGYPAARKRVFDAALAADANLVVLAGDTHNGWAFDLAQDGTPVGVEFGVSSVTSPGFEGYLPQIPTQFLERALVDANPQLQWADTSRRGYMAVELTPQAASCEWRFVSGVRQRGTALGGTHNMASALGSNTLAMG